MSESWDSGTGLGGGYVRKKGTLDSRVMVVNGDFKKSGGTSNKEVHELTETALHLTNVARIRIRLWGRVTGEKLPNKSMLL
jgi:hypothetical protein